MSSLPTLYKKTSTGKIQYWNISVIENSDHSTAYDICTNFGQVDGKEQTTTDMITKGKNAGKKNETSVQEQAQAEAFAKWEKQKKKGYVESIEAAQTDQVDDLIEGGIVPMLAHKFTEQAHKIKYPARVQPKLDGIRCIAIVKDGECTLWSRTRKPINSMPHIVAELESIFSSVDIILDGELYNHDFKANFEHIVSMVRQDEPHEKCEDVQYHIYDIAGENQFSRRTAMLAEFLEDLDKDSSLRLVQTKTVTTEEQVLEEFEKERALGYEGVMVRNAESKYVNKRSYDLLKVKEFDDSEFSIVGIEEGRGKLAGHAIFVCAGAKGENFQVKMKGDTAQLKAFFENHALWEGKKLTVQYQGLTSYGIPRFPVGLRIREQE